MECLDDNAASEFVSGALSGAATAKVEKHLASCRECRDLVAALAGAGDDDSQAETRERERISESQAGKLPRKYSIGDRVGRYLVLGSLGAGGMGVVFSAYDPQLDRKVALKLLRANLGVNAKDARARLKREAQAIAQLNHPNVVAVYDVGTTDEGDVYIAMEFVEGDTLTTWLKRWPRTWREILEIFHQAARGLMAAHGVGLLHRDFKPDNVLVGGDGRVRVTDFGLARSVLAPDDPQRVKADTTALHQELTATGTVLGTPRYMPPEQLLGPDIDARSDQFSFSVALYEALYGTHPLPGATSVSMLEHGDEALSPPEGTRVPTAISRAVMRGLSRERSKRYPTLAALVSDLVPPVQRSPMRLAVAAGIGLVVIGGATAAVMTRPEPLVHVEPSESPEIKLLYNRIQQLEQERKELIKALDTQAKTLRDLEHVKEQLIAKESEIHSLVDEVTKLRAAQVTAGKPKPLGTTSLGNADVTAAIQSVQPSLEKCFDEWSQRPTFAAIGSALRRRSKDAQLLVKLGVTPDGLAHDSTATGEQDLDNNGSLVDAKGVLSFCVESAVGRVLYPKGPEALDVEVQVVWSEGNVNTSARITARHDASDKKLDM